MTADQLAETVRDCWGTGRMEEAFAALAELQTRANQRDNLAGLEELLAQTEERVRLLKIYALATEKERDEARRVVDVLKRDWRRAKARLAETLKALERIVAAADADAALNLRDIAFIARTAPTTHPADE